MFTFNSTPALLESAPALHGPFEQPLPFTRLVILMYMINMEAASASSWLATSPGCPNLVRT